MKSLILLWIVCAQTILSKCEKQLRFSRDKTCPSKVLSLDNCQLTVAGRSSLHCAVKCSSQQGCVYSAWDSNLRQCRLCQATVEPDCSNTDPVAVPAYQWVCENGGTLNASLGGCSCVAGFAGLQCERLIYDCREGEYLHYPGGVYDIKPQNAPVSFKARCWMEWGGRLFLTQRKSGSLLFNRTWQEYKNGFGNLQGDHWLGLQQIYYLTNSGFTYVLLVECHRKENSVYLQQYYPNFKISNEASHYRLSFSSSWPNGDPAKTLGDSLSSALGSRFSTYDADHDDDDTENCALRHQSGWWFPSPCNLTEGNPLGRLVRPDDEVWSGKPEDVFWLNDLGTMAPWIVQMWLYRQND